MYKLFSSSRDSDDLSIGFQISTDSRERALTSKKTTKLVIMLEFIIPRKAGYCNHLRVFVCLFVCLFVSRISQKLLVGFR